MQRATIDDVKNVYSAGSGASDDEIQSAIDIANAIVDAKLVGGTGTTALLLEKIEILLSAHFLVINLEKGGLKGEKIGDASESFATVSGEGLSATRYGQQAMTLDPTGKLTKLGKKRATLKAYPISLTKSD